MKKKRTENREKVGRVSPLRAASESPKPDAAPSPSPLPAKSKAEQTCRSAQTSAQPENAAQPAPNPSPPPAEPDSTDDPVIPLRDYQRAIFLDRKSGLVILHWSRQIGKSYALAAWAVDRLLTQLRDNDTWLVTVLSNSRENGMEFVLKCQQVCNQIGALFDTKDESTDITYENMRMEVRVILNAPVNSVNSVKTSRTGRIKVLAANPRTARGFSGDLILDEFAFHEDSNAIWEAAEPILSANQQFLCRIASTGNGKHNMFYRMAACGSAAAPVPDSSGETPPELAGGDARATTPKIGEFVTSISGFRVSRITRTEAWKMGVPIYDSNTREPITPEEARRKALDKRAYDQNYECQFADENMTLLTHELIQQAERPGLRIDEQQWSSLSLDRMQRAEGELFLGGDIGRNRDMTVFAALERIGNTRRIIAMLRMGGMRLPAQEAQLNWVCGMPKFRRACMDMTGIGLGLVEYAQERWGSKIAGVNFAATEPVNDQIRAEGRKAETARVTEIMATELLTCFEERSIEIHVELDADARDDLRKPEKITSPGGRVSIAAVRDEAGHADHFWAFALAVRAAGNYCGPVAYAGITGPFVSHRSNLFGMGKLKPGWGMRL